jgi:hypothetical protein
MITEAIYAIIKTFLGGIKTFAGDYEIHLPQMLFTMLSDVMGWDDILPIHEILDCIFLVMTFWFILFSWYLISKIIDWVAGLI